MILPLIGGWKREFHPSTSLRTGTSYGYLIKNVHFWATGNINTPVINLLFILAIFSNSSYLTSEDNSPKFGIFCLSDLGLLSHYCQQKLQHLVAMMASWECSFMNCQEQKNPPILYPDHPTRCWQKEPQLAVAWTEVPVSFVQGLGTDKQISVLRDCRMWSSTKCAPRATLRTDFSLSNKEQINACQKEEPWDLCGLPGSGHISAFSEQVRKKKRYLFLYFKKVKEMTHEI